MKKRTRTKIRKSICAIMIAIMAAFCLTACGSAKLAEGFDEATVKAEAQKALDYLIAGEYEDCRAMMDASMQENLSAEVLAANMEAMTGNTGAFQEYKSVAVVGQKDAEGADYAVAVIVADFESGKLTFNVSFNGQMEIIGLWMK